MDSTTITQAIIRGMNYDAYIENTHNKITETGHSSVSSLAI